MKRTPASSWLLVLLAAAVGSGYKEVPPPAKVVLPPPLSAAESLAAIQVPDGFVVELVAAEPTVMDPIDVVWGPDGRMWVVEMADYPSGMDGKGKPGGRIRVLESTRGDGHYDKATLFAEELRAPMSVLPWRDGVLVVAVPEVLLLRDTNGDGRADTREVLFSGLGVGNEQHLTNGLQWSLDGWLHMANGNSGGKITSPKMPGALEVGQRDFRILPDTGSAELVSGQSQFGRNRDDWGNWFGCNNSNPIWHFALEEHYLRRNPHFAPPNSTVSLPKIPGASPVFPRSETIARFNDPHGFNHFTSACGLMIYRDDLLGPEFAGNAFVCEPVHNLVSRQIVRPAGATFQSERAPQELASEFFASKDNWSRFSTVRAGPDGGLYIVDMYRLVIEHPKWIPDAWQKELGDLRAGEFQGRIYRVRPKGVALRPVPRLDRADVAGLVAALESPSGTVRDLAQQLLTWREEKSAAPALERLAGGSPRAETRAQALWTLQTTGALTPAVVGRALQDPHPGVRRQAIRLSEGYAATHPELLAPVAALADDADAAVRQQVAYTLGEWRQPAAGVALAKLVRAGEDRFVRAAAMSSALPHADTLLARLTARGPADDPVVLEVATVTQNARALASLLSAVAASRAAEDLSRQLAGLTQLLDWLQRNNKSLAQLQATADEAMRAALEATDRVFEAARRVAVDAAAPVAQRIAAVGVIGRGRTRQAGELPLLSQLLGSQSPVQLQLAAVAALGRMRDNSIPKRLLADWTGYGPSVRGAVLDLLTSRAAWAQELLDRLEADSAMRAQVEPGRRLALSQHGNPRVAERAAAIFDAATDPNRQQVIDRYLAALSALRGDPARGRAVFTNTCSACHKFGDVPGQLIGPDLAAVKDRSAGYLATHTFDPNRAVEDRYVLYTGMTQDGRSLAGMMTAEAGNSITLVGLDGAEQSILRSELRSLISTGRSLMPDGLEAAVNEQAMADLVAFLAAGGQTSAK